MRAIGRAQSCKRGADPGTFAYGPLDRLGGRRRIGGRFKTSYRPPFEFGRRHAPPLRWPYSLINARATCDMAIGLPSAAANIAALTTTTRNCPPESESLRAGPSRAQRSAPGPGTPGAKSRAALRGRGSEVEAEGERREKALSIALGRLVVRIAMPRKLSIRWSR